MAIKLDTVGPVFFRQERVGRYGRIFRIHKFRTMIASAESKGLQVTVGRDPRVTRVGAFLRRYKFDELPQLIDIFIGKMSLVGPRPEVPKYVEHYPSEMRDLILSIRPGITDNASILYRSENDTLANSTDPEKTYIEEILPEKLRLCVDYVQHRTFLGDLRIIFRTLMVLKG